MERHPWNPDELGDCQDCNLPERSRWHLTETPAEATQVASRPVAMSPSMPSTSQAAAMAVWPRAGSQRDVVLRAIAAAGEYGATDDQIAAATGLDGNSVRPRRGELAPLLVRQATNPDGTPVFRGSNRQNDARVWVLTDYARTRLSPMAEAV